MSLKVASLVLLYKTVICVGNGPIVEIPTGKIQGREAVTLAKTTYFSFEGIPYAKAPIGDLRFKAPQPVEPWNDVFDGTAPGATCLQLGIDLPTDSEDCLLLSVHTPQLPENSTNVALPVMFYVHGGGFTTGTGMGSPPDSFVDNGVVFVSFNYRLGVLGLLSTQDEVIPGNNALKDQRLALQWTHDNIRSFGGDPDKITLFGASSGATSIGFQVLNQNSEGLFRAVIMESGVSICPWTYQPDARRIAFEFGSVVNSTFEDSDDSEALLRFLQSLGSVDLDTASEEYLSDVRNIWDDNVAKSALFAPVIEVKNPDAFITDKMYGMLETGDFLKVPTLLGFNSEEKLFFNQDAALFQSIVDIFDEDLDVLVPNDMRISDRDEHAEMAVRIRDIYTDGEPFGTNLGAALRYASDNAYTRSIIRYAELVSQYAETYFYQFSYDGERGGVSVHYEGAESVGHVEEVFYLFCSALGNDCDFSKYPESDKVTFDRMVTMWTNFAKYLNPTPEASKLLQNISWPQVSVDGGDLLYLDIGENLEVKNHPKNNTYQKWISLYDSLEINDFDTF